MRDFSNLCSRKLYEVNIVTEQITAKIVYSVFSGDDLIVHKTAVKSNIKNWMNTAYNKMFSFVKIYFECGRK